MLGEPRVGPGDRAGVGHPIVVGFPEGDDGQGGGRSAGGGAGGRAEAVGSPR